MFKHVAPVLLVTAFLVALPLSANAQQEGEGEVPDVATSDKKLKAFGYLTVAYADTDGNQILGMTEDGTSAYSNLALQLRYAATKRDSFVLQLSRERLGRSPVQPYRDDIEVDWAFYRHDFDSDTYIKLGRSPIPIGIYNELRDAGHLLPFYTPPVSLYLEGQFVNESIDGLVLGHRFLSDSSWSLDVDLYAGQWDILESRNDGPLGYAVDKAEVDDALGAQMWLNTPVRDLRLGAGANRFDVKGGLYRAADTDRWKAFILSLDFDSPTFLVRGEYYRREVPLGLPGLPFAIPKLESDSYYLQLGYRFASGWSVYAQAERGDVGFDVGFIPAMESDFWEDYALSLGYSTVLPRVFSSRAQATVRLELHRNEGYLVEYGANQIFFTPPAKTDYGLLSVSLALF